MDKKRAKATGKAALLLLLVLVLAAASTWGALLGDKSVKPAPEDADYFRNHGLPPETELDAVPNSYQSDRVIFDDRVLYAPRLAQEDVAENQQSIHRFFEAVGKKFPQMGRYIMMVPNRIAFETPFSTDVGYLSRVTAENTYYRHLETSFAQTMEGAAETIPVMDTLQEHQEEYLFYRTDTVWTARGAYHGGQEFLKAVGESTFPIESFHESAKSSGSGALGHELDLPSDRHYVYLYDDYNPLVQKLPDGSATPMISVTRGGNGIFLGYQDKAYHIAGRAENGRALMIMGRGNARILAPWMVNSFEEIVVADMLRCRHGKLDFLDVMETYQITDLLVVEDMESLDSSRQRTEFMNAALKVLQPEKEEE